METRRGRGVGQRGPRPGKQEALWDGVRPFRRPTVPGEWGQAGGGRVTDTVALLTSAHREAGCSVVHSFTGRRNAVFWLIRAPERGVRDGMRGTECPGGAVTLRQPCPRPDPRGAWGLWGGAAGRRAQPRRPHVLRCVTACRGWGPGPAHRLLGGPRDAGHTGLPGASVLFQGVKNRGTLVEQLGSWVLGGAPAPRLLQSYSPAVSRSEAHRPL